jgi:hypothetical protein
MDAHQYLSTGCRGSFTTGIRNGQNCDGSHRGGLTRLSQIIAAGDSGRFEDKGRVGGVVG